MTLYANQPVHPSAQEINLTQSMQYPSSEMPWAKAVFGKNGDRAHFEREALTPEQAMYNAMCARIGRDPEQITVAYDYTIWNGTVVSVSGVRHGQNHVDVAESPRPNDTVGCHDALVGALAARVAGGFVEPLFVID